MNKWLPPVKEEKKVTPKYESNYGSHAKMINEAETEKLDREGFVVCEDDYGMYVTEKGRLDNGLADPHRNSFSRLDSLCRKTRDKDKDK